MKQSRLLAVVSILALLVLAIPVFGQSDAIEPNIFFQNVWVRSTPSADATPEPGAVSAAYMTIANAGGVGVRLLSAVSPVAEIVEIHEMRMNGDVMEMRPVEGGLDILPGGVTVLEPGGYHLMMLNLTQPLVVGQAVPFTLTFETYDNAGELTGETFTVEIAAPVLAEAPEPNNLAFSLIWARPADEGTTSATYMHILNFGDPDTLVGASTDVAGVVEIHNMTMNGDVMEMRPVEDGVPLAYGDIGLLEPGGLHIMMMDLTQALEEGSAFTLTLQFESGTQVTVGVPIYDRTMMEMSGM
ncbi:MAG: copper chaperone PCu(A)C [Anaerolineae bacterium]